MRAAFANGCQWDESNPALRQVLAGRVFVSEAMASNLLQKVPGGAAPATEGGSPIDALTDFELEIFQLLGQGKGAKDIAKLLHISVKTVEAHREHIKQKLNIKPSNELLRYAIESRMLRESLSLAHPTPTPRSATSPDRWITYGGRCRRYVEIVCPPMVAGAVPAQTAYAES